MNTIIILQSLTLLLKHAPQSLTTPLSPPSDQCCLLSNGTLKNAKRIVDTLEQILCKEYTPLSERGGGRREGGEGGQ